MVATLPRAIVIPTIAITPTVAVDEEFKDPRPGKLGHVVTAVSWQICWFRIMLGALSQLVNTSSVGIVMSKPTRLKIMVGTTSECWGLG
jgi:hypothetical protein